MEILKGILKKFGYTIRRVDTPTRSLERGLGVLAQSIRPTGVIDVGVGRGTPELYAAFPPKSFPYLLVEADPYFADTLKELGQTLPAKTELSFCGSQKGSITLHRAANHQQSSFRRTKKWSPVDDVTVPVEQLDMLIRRNGLPSKDLLIKLDAEGAEMEILKGAGDALCGACAVVLETSVGPRFEEEKGRDPFGEIVSFMHEHGFRVVDMLAGSNQANMFSQVDLVFIPIKAGQPE